MKIIVLPDIHGRDFWKSAREHIAGCDKVIFLGDYFDPYGFEIVSVTDAIDNFREILSFVKECPEKAVMLLGNHDLPYYSEQYRALARYHCRWSREWHSYISRMFENDSRLFKMAHEEDGILFTHAGCTALWLKSINVEPENLSDLVEMLNALPTTNVGLRQLFMVSRHRGGRDVAGSCVWADIDELLGDIEGLRFNGSAAVKQVFGHTLQVKHKINGGIVSGEPITTQLLKMLDNRTAYLLDTTTFTHEALL